MISVGILSVVQSLKSIKLDLICFDGRLRQRKRKAVTNTRRMQLGDFAFLFREFHLFLNFSQLYACYLVLSSTLRFTPAIGIVHETMKLLKSHNIALQQYADDTQLLFSLSTASVNTTLQI